MPSRRSPQPRRPRRRWRRAALAALALLALASASAWWLSAGPEVSGGTPRLVLDRDALDFGYVAFDTPVRAVFTLRNAGDGVLRLAGVPPVEVRAGC